MKTEIFNDVYFECLEQYVRLTAEIPQGATAKDVAAIKQSLEAESERLRQSLKQEEDYALAVEQAKIANDALTRLRGLGFVGIPSNIAISAPDGAVAALLGHEEQSSTRNVQ